MTTEPNTPDQEVATRLTDVRVWSFVLGFLYLFAKLLIIPGINIYLQTQGSPMRIEWASLETLDVLLLVAMPMGLSAFNTLLTKVVPK